MTFQVCGYSPTGKPIVCGAFQAADTLGFPLSASMDQAEKNAMAISLPHYFASALEHGWDDKQTFGKIREALADRGNAGDMQLIEHSCIAMLMEYARKYPNEDAMELARRMRMDIEGGDKYLKITHDQSRIHTQRDQNPR